MKLSLLLASLYTLIFYQSHKIEKNKDVSPAASKETLNQKKHYLQIAADEKDKKPDLWIQSYSTAIRYPG